MSADAHVPADVEKIVVDLGDRAIRLSHSVLDNVGEIVDLNCFHPIWVDLRLLADFYEITDGECDAWEILLQNHGGEDWDWAAIGDFGNIGVGPTPQEAMRAAMAVLEGGITTCGECGGTGQEFIGPAHDNWGLSVCPGFCPPHPRPRSH